MSDFLPAPAAWPFSPGEGPFRVKGTAYRGHLEYVAAEVQGGVPRMLEGFEDQRLAAYLEQPFLASSFYDLHPLVMAAGPSADLSGLTPRAFAETRSRRQAPKDLRGVYRFLLSMVPTRTVARRIPQLFTQLFDFGKAEISREECSEIDATFDGIPSALAPRFGTCAPTVSQRFALRGLRGRRSRCAPRCWLGARTVFRLRVSSWKFAGSNRR